MFKLNAHFDENCFKIMELKQCLVLLENNSNYPWLILVPKVASISELTDLNKEQYHAVMEEVYFISEIVKDVFKPHKLNIANLGNRIKQLHIHVIARFENDLAWPNPVWGNGKNRYNAIEEKNMVNLLNEKIKTKLLENQSIS